MANYNACVFCLKSVKLNPGLSLHVFPKDPVIRLKWLEACNFNESDILPNRKLCSFHFEDHSYTGQHKKYIKRGAIPTLHMKNEYNVPKNPLSSGMFSNSTSTFPNTPMHISLTDTDKLMQKSLKRKHSPIPIPEYTLMSEPSTPVSSETQDCNKVFDTPKRKNKRKSFIGDIKSPDLATPKRAKKQFYRAKCQVMIQRRKIKVLNETIRRLRKKISSLDALFKHLKSNNLITEEAHDEILNNTSEPIKAVINRSLMSKNAKYTPVIRSFALTLQFYSAKAYSFVRKTFNKLLPHPATLKKWYSVIEGEPGFTHEAFIAIKTKVLQSSQPIICNIVIDEMAIRKQISFLNGKFYGGVNLGTGLENCDSDNIQEATNALVFLAVGINGHWKVPLGYFLVHSFSGTERANLLTKCLELIADIGAKCFSITFDGAPSNLSMCKSLGANFDFFSQDFKPWFHNPAYPEKENERIFIFWDACHMIKLIRNTLGDKKVLINNEGSTIKWDYIKELQNIQESKGLHAANKLKKTHISYYENKMNVRLAVQTLSASVSSGLLFCEELKLLSGSKPTSEFCKMFNDAFDILNCRNRLAKGDYDFPTDEKTIFKIKAFIEKFTLYVKGLKFEASNNNSEGQQILISQRKTGFLGLIICLNNLIHLYEVVKKNGMSYLLSYKLSQDHLEVFFSALRSRGGFNNNPNAIQFKSAYKRLLVRHQVSGSEYGNCSTIDTASILFVSANQRKSADAIYNDTNLEENNSIFNEYDHDYDYRVPELEEFVVDIVKYTSGFIVRKINKKKNICSVCNSFLIDLHDKNASVLLKLKTKGRLIIVSSDVHKVCLISEYIIRMNTEKLLTKKNIKLLLIVKTMNEVCLDPTLFNSIEMKNHILNQDPLDNHRGQLLKLIIDYYITLRLNHFAKMHTLSITSKNIRRNYTKLILFKNQ